MAGGSTALEPQFCQRGELTSIANSKDFVPNKFPLPRDFPCA